VPGDPEWAAETVRLVEGVPLSPAVVADLRAVAEATGVEFVEEAADG
jgi:hypothetical protein